MKSSTNFKKVILLVIDGFGLAPDGPGNAILRAGMPHLEDLLTKHVSMPLTASGLVVGLPWGEPGNSEVGHTALGCGRVVVQDLAHIHTQIRSGDFYTNEALLKAITHAKKHNSALHLIGCTSPGGIHSHTDHLIALLELAKRHNLKKVFVHVIADGQDMPAQDAIQVLTMLEPHLRRSGASIASVQGRSFAMDRVLNWKLTEQVWRAIVDGNAPPIENPQEYVQSNYEKGVGDYAIDPATVVSQGKPIGPVQDNDAVIFYDFRSDRAQQLATPFIESATFQAFPLRIRPANLMIVTMTRYGSDFSCPVAYESAPPPNTLGEVISNAGIRQWRIAEKEKEAHVTSFLNGGRMTPSDGERRCIVASRFMRGDQYVVHPEMSAREITSTLIERLNDDAVLYAVNLANLDMIGHTGNLAATERAVRVVDDCIGQIANAALERGDTALIITADHGNAEELLDPFTGGEDTQHSTRSVPIVFVLPEVQQGQEGESIESLTRRESTGSLIDVAPTILKLLDIKIPKEMTGSALI